MKACHDNVVWSLLDTGDLENLQAFTPPHFAWLSIHEDDKITPLQLLGFEELCRSCRQDRDRGIAVPVAQSSAIGLCCFEDVCCPRKAALAGISSEDFDPYFRVIEWVVGEGADPAQQAPVSCTYGTDLWKNHDKKGLAC